MKKYFFKIFVKRNLSALIIAAIISTNTNAAEINVFTEFHESTATIKYVGADSNSYMFNVAYNNEEGERFSLSIVDEAGNTLFSGTYSDKKFDKRFRLMKDIVDGKLNFVIKNLKDNSVQTFQVTTTSQVIEDVVVKKVNR